MMSTVIHILEDHKIIWRAREPDEIHIDVYLIVKHYSFQGHLFFSHSFSRNKSYCKKRRQFKRLSINLSQQLPPKEERSRWCHKEKKKENNPFVTCRKGWMVIGHMFEEKEKITNIWFLSASFDFSVNVSSYRQSLSLLFGCYLYLVQSKWRRGVRWKINTNKTELATKRERGKKLRWWRKEQCRERNIRMKVVLKERRRERKKRRMYKCL